MEREEGEGAAILTSDVIDFTVRDGKRDKEDFKYRIPTETIYIPTESKFMSVNYESLLFPHTLQFQQAFTFCPFTVAKSRGRCKNKQQQKRIN